MTATRIFTNGKIYTVNKEQPWAEAVVLQGNKIAFVGSNEEALKMQSAETHVQDLQGKMMLPGLIDGHMHPLMASAFATGAQLADCKNEQEILQTVKEFVEANPNNETYFGQGFQDSIFTHYHPTADALDEICSDKPILLVASSCHGAWCNHKAFELAGVDKNTPDITPNSNYFVRDAQGNPTGRCIESCYIQVAKGADYFPRKTFNNCLTNFGKQFAALGVTTFVDCGVYSFVLDSLDENFAEFIRNESFTQRLFGGFYLATSTNEIEECVDGVTYIVNNLKNDDKLAFTFFKVLGDGLIEAKSAALVEPYGDGTKVVTNFTVEQAKEIALYVAKHGYDINIHAIGDATTHLAIEMLQAIRDAGCADTRFVVSHSQSWLPEDIKRAGKLGAFINSTGVWHDVTTQEYKESVGATLFTRQYPIKSLIDAGCTYGQGSDFPVSEVPPAPFNCIEVGLTRQKIGNNTTTSEDVCEAPTLEESIESFTINNAWEIRMEDKLGSIEVGKLADLVVVDKNLFDIPTTEIHNVKVTETIKDGVTTYKA